MAAEDMNKLLQMAQEMQNSMKQAHEELQALEYVGESGGGLVKITMNGRYQAKKVAIDASAMENKEVLEDLVAAAINATVTQIEKGAEDKMKKLSKSLGMPTNPGAESGDPRGDSGQSGGKWDKFK